MGFYPDMVSGPRRGTREWDDHIAQQPLPHPLDEPYTCGCVECEEWHRARVVPGSLVIGRVLDHRRGGSGGFAWTWRHDEEPKWDHPVRKPSLVLGLAAGVSSRKDLTCVVLLTPDMGLRVSAAEWLVVLGGGRAPVQPPVVAT